MARRRTTTDADTAVEPQDSNLTETGNQLETTPEVAPKPRRTRKSPAASTTASAVADDASTDAPAEQPTPKPRRTRAKAVDAVTVENVQADEANQPTEEVATPARQTRTRRPAKQAVEASPESVDIQPATITSTEPDVQTDTNIPQRTRGRRRQVETTVVVAAPDVTNTDSAPPSNETDENGEVSAEPGDTNRSRNQRTRRGRGRRGRGTDVTSEAGQETDETTGDSDEPTTGDVSQDASARSGRSRRGRGRRGRTVESDGTEANPAAESADASGSDVDSDGEDGRGDRRRGRGLRRTRTVAAPQLMLGGDTASDATETDADENATPARRTQRSANLPPAIPLLVPIPEEPLPPVFAPLSTELLERFSASNITVVNGRPVLHVNGDARPAIMFFVNTEGDFDRSVAQRQIRYAYQAGVRIFTMLAHLPWRTAADERNYTHLEEMLQFVAEIAPEAMILPRLIFSPPSGWVRRNPDDMAIGVDGPTGDVSLGSQAFWAGDAEDALRAAIERVAAGPHASRILGVYLEHGEWIYDRVAGYDRSPVNTKAFRRWLRSEYRGNVVQLRAAWHDGNVTFDNADVPSYPAPTNFPVGANQFFGPRERRWVDYHKFSSAIAAQVINRLGRVVKETSGDKLTVAVSYGYTFELPRGHSGHLALADVLAAPYVDMLTGPFSYTGREAGGSAPFPSPVDSIALHGKLWIAEDDTKTYLASDESPDSYNVRLDDLRQTQTVHARNFGAALAKGTGISWMDLWGEGWLDTEEIWEALAAMVDFAYVHLDRQLKRTEPVPAPAVAVFVDEASCMSVRDEDLLNGLVGAHRDTFARSGVDVGYYLLSDLASEKFSHTVKLAVLLNALTIPEATRSAIRTKLNNHGTTVVWMMAPGCIDGPVSEVSELVGVHLKLQPYASKAGSTFLNNSGTPLLEGINGMSFGDSVRRHPLIAVDDFRSRTLAEYPNHNPSVAIRKHPRHQSMFIGEPVLSLGLLRNLCRLAGIHRYQADDDVMWVSDNWLAIHSGPGGGIKVMLPVDSGLYDVVYGEVITTRGYGRGFPIPEKGTRLLVIGGPDVQAEYGADGGGVVDGFAEDILPVFEPFVFEADDVPTQVDPAPEEDLLAKAIAMMPDHMMETKAVDIETDPNTGEQTRRRRRRRRGEGYDREVAEPLAENASVTPGETKTLPPLDELLPESTEVTGELPPVPDELQPLEAIIPVEDAPAKRRRAAPRRAKKVTEDVASPDGEAASTDTSEAVAVPQETAVEPEAPEGE
ncbi:MAG: hypothetical protein RLZZ78_184 [Armatimonadota bacterium]